MGCLCSKNKNSGAHNGPKPELVPHLSKKKCDIGGCEKDNAGFETEDVNRGTKPSMAVANRNVRSIDATLDLNTHLCSVIKLSLGALCVTNILIIPSFTARL
jgi:hypothetical protein